MVSVGEGLSDDATRGCGDNSGHNGEEEGGGGVLETGSMAMHDDEGHGDAGCHGEEDVEPPEGPGEVDEPVTPLLAAEDHHIDDGYF